MHTKTQPNTNHCKITRTSRNNTLYNIKIIKSKPYDNQIQITVQAQQFHKKIVATAYYNSMKII